MNITTEFENIKDALNYRNRICPICNNTIDYPGETDSVFSPKYIEYSKYNMRYKIDLLNNKMVNFEYLEPFVPLNSKSLNKLDLFIACSVCYKYDFTLTCNLLTEDFLIRDIFLIKESATIELSDVDGKLLEVANDFFKKITYVYVVDYSLRNIDYRFELPLIDITDPILLNKINKYSIML